ncbi:hypothetical protein OK074_1212 [Actinobacteria bacterium OK074]|nr:hypothetical protein OK074_1212 [Actinobacteria bacterium OK074]
MRTRVRGWRWRRNPLRRHSDVVEAWTALVVMVLLLVGAPLAGMLAGWWAYDDGRAQAAQQRADRHRVPAVLLEDAPKEEASVQGGKQPLYEAKVRWTVSGQGTRTGPGLVPAGAKRGEHTEVWLNAAGQSVTPPITDAAVWQATLTTGVWAAGSAAGLVLGAHFVVRRVAQRHRMAEWEREWERMGPEWGRRTA